MTYEYDRQTSNQTSTAGAKLKAMAQHKTAGCHDSRSSSDSAFPSVVAYQCLLDIFSPEETNMLANITIR